MDESAGFVVMGRVSMDDVQSERKKQAGRIALKKKASKQTQTQQPNERRCECGGEGCNCWHRNAFWEEGKAKGRG